MNKIQAGLLPVSSIHKIYYETYGNENGIPLLCFHGGPGGGFSTRYIDMIDLEKFYVIFFDQRGCGRSTPDAEIAENTCQDAVDDAYRLLCHLNISKCVVSGYSYGRTTDNSNTTFALTVCPECKDTHTHTEIDGDNMHVKCDKCGTVSTGHFSSFDYWLHHSISSLGSWEMFPQNNVVILGLDHYLYKDDAVREALYYYFFGKPPIEKRCLYGSLVVDGKGNKMGKSSKNYFDISTEEAIAILKANQNSKYIYLSQKTR